MKRLLATTVTALALVSACGVAEDTTAATVDGHDISVEAVEKLAKTPYVVQSAQAEGLVSSTATVKGSTSLRTALGLLVQAQVFESGVTARKGKITDVDRDAAEAQITDYETNQQQGAAIDARARAVILRVLSAQAALGRILGGADIENAATADKVQAYFDENSADFAQVCVDGFAVAGGLGTTAQAALDGGADVQDILANADLQAQPLSQDGSETCVATSQVTEPTLADLINNGPLGEWSRSDLDDPQAGPVAVFIRPNSRDQPTLDDPDVVDQITQLLQQAATTKAQEAVQGEAEAILSEADVDIDSRYGRWDPSDPALLVAPPLAPRQSAKAASETQDQLTGLQGQ